MKNTDEPIKAAPTLHREMPLDRMRNILADTLYELGYDDTLVVPLLKRNVIDFSTVEYTSHIISQLEERYGESMVWHHLEDAVAFEGLATSLTGELGEAWRATNGKTFRERIQQLIVNPLEKLGLKVVTCYALENSTLSEELENVKQQVAIDYGEFNSYFPNVDLVIYASKGSRVIAVVSCPVNLKNRIIETAYWKHKLQADENRAAIKYYLITADIGETLKIESFPRKERGIAETDFDGTYVLTEANLEQSDKVKLFEHFLEDFKQLLENN